MYNSINSLTVLLCYWQLTVYMYDVVRVVKSILTRSHTFPSLPPPFYLPSPPRSHKSPSLPPPPACPPPTCLSTTAHAGTQDIACYLNRGCHYLSLPSYTTITNSIDSKPYNHTTQLYTRLYIRLHTRGGFLNRRSSAIRRFFAGFLRWHSRTIMKSFLKKIVLEFSEIFVRFLCKYLVNSWAIFFGETTSLLYDYRISEILRIEELRLMRNQPMLVGHQVAQDSHVEGILLVLHLQMSSLMIMTISRLPWLLNSSCLFTVRADGHHTDHVTD